MDNEENVLAMIENRKNIQNKIHNEKSRMKHVLALMYVESSSR